MLRNAGGFTYTLTYKRVKNLNLRVRADGIFVSAPYRTPPETADAFVLHRADWIRAALQHQQQLAPAPEGVVYCLGQAYTVKPRYGRGAAYLSADALNVWVDDPQDTAKIARAVGKWRKAQIEKLFPQALAEAREAFSAYSLPQYTLRVRTMKSRWGSCHVQKHIITLNARLLDYPYACLRYVAAHELCHFIHPDHSAAFYAVLARAEPNWAALRARLRTAPSQ